MISKALRLALRLVYFTRPCCHHKHVRTKQTSMAILVGVHFPSRRKKKKKNSHCALLLFVANSVGVFPSQKSWTFQQQPIESCGMLLLPSLALNNVGPSREYRPKQSSRTRSGGSGNTCWIHSWNIIIKSLLVAGLFKSSRQ